MLSPETLRQVHLINIRARRAVTGAFAGQYLSIFKGRGIEFAEVRDYEPGDDIRSIDWNVTARMGKPFIKRQIEERELTIMLLVDISASMQFGSHAKSKADIAAEIVAVLTQSAVRAHDRVGMVLFSDRVEAVLPPAGGRLRTQRLVSAILATKPRGTTTNAGMALDYLESTLRRRAIGFLISDFGGPDFDGSLRRTLRTHEVIPVWIRDPHEIRLPEIGLVRVVDLESGERVLIDTSYPPAREAFEKRQLDLAQARRKRLLRLGLDIIEIDTGKPYVHPILQFFQRREQRRLSAA